MADWLSGMNLGSTGLQVGDDWGYTPTYTASGATPIDMGGGSGLFGSWDDNGLWGLGGLDYMGGGQGLYGTLDPNDPYGFSGYTTGGLYGSDPSMAGGDSSIWSNIMGGLSGAGSNIGGAISKLGSWLGGTNAASTGSNLSDLAKLTMGGLGLYGNWRNAEEQRGLMADQLGLQRELGMGNLDLGRDRLGLDRDLGMGRLGLDRDRFGLESELGRGNLDLNRDRFGLESELGRGNLDLNRDRFGLESELGRGNLAQNQQRIDLERQLGLGNLGLSRDRFGLEQELGRRGMDLQEDQFGVGALDDMASKAMGMQLLINRGRMTADQVNPWLNEMYTGRQQMFGKDPELSRAYAKNPYGSMPVGTTAKMPTSANQFFTGLDPLRKAEGGLASLNEYLAGGVSGGQADKINAYLSDGEYVFDADTVAALGDGNTKAGAAKLDQMREEIRRHKRSAPASKIPPAAKNPMDYLGEV